MTANIKSVPFGINRVIKCQEIKGNSTPFPFETTQQQSEDSSIINDDIDGEYEFEDAKSDFEHFEDVLAVRNAVERENGVKQLISDGLDVAVERRYSSKIVGLLINNGSKINTIDHNGCTILHRSVKNKNIKVVKLLLETNKKEVDKLLLANFLPESIFVHQIEINAQDKNGFTALDYAKQSSEMYALLQEYGARHSKKFLHCRDLNVEELDFDKLVVDDDYCFDALEKALKIKDEASKIKAIDWLLENGANINVTKDNKTLLSIAAEKGDVEAAMLLMKKGLREGINSQDSEGRILLLNAILHGKSHHIKYFIDSDIDIQIPDNNGNTAMHYAFINQRKFLTEVDFISFFTTEEKGLVISLQKRGADFYARNNNGLTPFEYAFKARAVPSDIARLLRVYVEKGNKSKNIQLVKKVRSPSGETLLEYFISNKLFDSAQSCMNLGANINQPLSDGSSLLSKALQNKNIEGIDFLLKKGAKANLDHGGKKKNNKLYFRAAFGCVVAFSLGMGIAATFTLVRMSSLALAVVAITSSVAVVASISLLILYKKIKSEKRKNRVAIDNLTPNANLVEAAERLFGELSSMSERIAEAGALYLEMQKSTKIIAERIGHKQKFIEAKLQNIQRDFASKLSNFQSFHDSEGSGFFKRSYAAVKDFLRIRSNVPISNLHLLSLSYHLSWEVLNAIFHAITDPTLASTILTAIREKRWPEDTQWSEVLRNTVPNLIRNQELMQNVIVPTLTDILKNLSESEEERKFIIYSLVLIKEMIDEVYTASAQESLPRILGAELASSISNIAVAINDLLSCYGEEEVERAKIANELDYLIGKLAPQETRQFVTYLREMVGTLTGFQGQIINGDKQSIRKLIDYCLGPEPNDKEAAEALLKSIFIYVKNNGCVETDVNSNLLNVNTEQSTAQRYAPLVAAFGGA